jgi:hypothetical protein
MEITLIIKEFSFVFSTKGRADAFLKELNKLIDKHEEHKGDCYMKFDYEM